MMIRNEMINAIGWGKVLHGNVVQLLLYLYRVKQNSMVEIIMMAALSITPISSGFKTRLLI